MSEIDVLTGRMIRIYRKARHMTIEQLAEGIHKSKATVGKYEKGTISLDIHTLYEIAKQLGMNPTQLLSEKTDAFCTERASIWESDAQRYMYCYDGRTKRIIRALLVAGGYEAKETSATLFYNVTSFDKPESCRALYWGRMQRHDYVTYYIMDNQSNNIEHVSICFMRSLDNSGVETGLISGISSRSMLPVSTKCVLSDMPLKEDECLIERLLLTKEDLQLIKKYNMFIVEQAEL